MYCVVFNVFPSFDAYRCTFLPFFHNKKQKGEIRNIAHFNILRLNATFVKKSAGLALCRQCA